MEQLMINKTPSVILSLRLQQFDLKCIPMEWNEMNEEIYEKQFKLGEAVFEALIQWNNTCNNEVHMLASSKLKQDVRNQIVKVISFFLFFF